MGSSVLGLRTNFERNDTGSDDRIGIWSSAKRIYDIDEVYMRIKSTFLRRNWIMLPCKSRRRRRVQEFGIRGLGLWLKRMAYRNGNISNGILMGKISLG
ncbi:unnamed protein product [Rhizophagus irregularis]|nr:unnamed protein product [Rhizophagus irregularis]